MGVSTITTINLLAKLQEVPDVRRRQGRLYPLASVLGMLILAALNGESSLRGMLGWGERHWQELARPLGFKGGTSAPVYGTVWRILHLLPLAALESVLGAWLATGEVKDEAALALDGKQLRGSKRRESGLPALQVVTAAAQGLGVVLGQELAEHLCSARVWLGRCPSLWSCPPSTPPLDSGRVDRKRRVCGGLWESGLPPPDGPTVQPVVAGALEHRKPRLLGVGRHLRRRSQPCPWDRRRPE